jgi:hypothetical protein
MGDTNAARVFSQLQIAIDGKALTNLHPSKRAKKAADITVT